MDSLKHEDGFYLAMLDQRANDLRAYSWTAEELSNELYIWPRQIDGSPLLQTTALGLMRLSGWWGLDRRLALETFEQVLLLTNKAPEDLKELEILTESAMETTDSFPPRLVFRELIWPYARRMRSFYNSESSRRLALIVIAIERHRLTNSGELPEDLDQLKQFGLSPVPLDPYDGNPLRYVSKTNGYWVYSVHADRTDDQGEVYRIGDERDYSLRVEWPAE